MTALPAFAGTVTGPDLLAKLEAMRVELEARTVSANARDAAVEAFLNRQTGGYGLGPVTDNVFTYSAKAIPGWTVATRKGRVSLAAALALGSWFDADGRASTCRLADLPNGATRFVAVTWNSAGSVSGANGAVTVTVFDVAADGSVSIVRQLAGQGYSVFAESQTVNAYVGMAQVVRISDTQFRVRAYYRVDFAYGISGANSLSTYTLNTDQGANTLTQTKDIDQTAYRNSTSNLGAWAFYATTSGFFRRRAWPVGTYGIAWPALIVGADTAFNGRQELGVLMTDRLPGSGFAEVRPLAPSSLATFTNCIERVGASLFATLTDGQSIGRTNPATGARVSVASLDDAHGGSAASVCLPYGVSGNPRLVAVSSTVFIAGFTNGAQFGSYLVTRDVSSGALTWRGLQDTTGVMGAVWAEAHAFSSTKAALWTLGTGWTFNLTTVSVDPAATPGLQASASPFTQAATLSVNLCTSVAGAVAGDQVILGAIERVGPDRIVTIARDATRGGCDIEVWDLA